MGGLSVTGRKNNVGYNTCTPVPISSMCFKRESMLAISRDSFEVSWPMLSRPPIKRPPMIQKLLFLPVGMSTAIGTGR